MMKYLFLGYGPICDRLIKELAAKNQSFEGVVYSKLAQKQNGPQVKHIDEWKDVDPKNVDVVINSWKTLNAIPKSSRFDILTDISEKAKDSLTFINLSSVAVYGECENEVDETSTPSPINKYGAEKLELENFLKSINLSRLVNLRIANVFGDERFNDFINLLINSRHTSSYLKIDHPSLMYRDFICISRVIKVLVSLSADTSFYGVRGSFDLNVCSGESLSLSDVIEIYSSITNSELRYHATQANLQTIRTSRISNLKLSGLLPLPKWNSVEDISAYIRGRLGA